MFDTKIAIVVRDDLATWQKLNVTAFLMSGITGAARRVRSLVGRHNEDRPGLAGVMIDACFSTQDRISRSRLAGDPPDVMIGPKLGRVGLFDFHRAEEAIALGRQATERALDEIAAVIAANRVPLS